MRSSAFYAVLGVGVFLIAGIVYFGTHHVHTAVLTSTVATSTLPSKPLTGLSIYTNGEYGFSIFYPATSTVSTTFDSTYHLPSTWRANALPNATGTPIVAIIGYKTQSDTHYPRYFEAEVRIGASTDPKEIAACTTAGNGESVLPSQTFGGTIWHVFSLSDAGMMQYSEGTSYRTIHDGACIALEQVEAGSSYVDTPSEQDIPQSVLTANFQALSAIVSTFSFARS